MFYNHKDFQVLGKDIFLFRGFLSKKEVEFVSTLITDDLWTPKDRVSVRQVEETMFIFDKIYKVVQEADPDCYINFHRHIVKMENGDDHAVHKDSYDYLPTREKAKNYDPSKPSKLERDNLYGMVVYLNDFIGGEIYYPGQNITIKPTAGDLVIHSSDEHCAHGVRTVQSTRYSIPNAIFKDVKVNI